MELSLAAVARAEKVLERSRAAAPRAVEDSVAVAGDLFWAALAAVGSLGGAALQIQQLQRAAALLNCSGSSCSSVVVIGDPTCNWYTRWCGVAVESTRH